MARVSKLIQSFIRQVTLAVLIKFGFRQLIRIGANPG